MDFIHNLFGKKINFNDKMERAIDQFKHIDWFANCGDLYNQECYYEFLQEDDLLKISKQLGVSTNYKNFVCLRNLFIEGRDREKNYIMRTTSSVNEGRKTMMRVLDAIDRRFFEKKQEINFDCISDKFLSCYQLGVPGNSLEIRRLFRNLLFELYFAEDDENMPLFFSKIIDIYMNGHIIVGWSGKFRTHEIDLAKSSIVSINPFEGKLILF